ncbi:disease resistance-like protein DSC1 [Pistacia vera]|uniref:disease resistance-like protein DSC1 n=1 Tax=Pistacia vera TaxID=55513 RepID=UPI0012634352|nr:disease resistance-like protein DSC1 [Pistacia vera]
MTQRGDEISPSLRNAIEVSKILVIVFSKGYASSRWCLEELVKILECKNMYGGIVIPVFYHVDPSDIRNRTGKFGDGFAELEGRFKEQPEMVQRWRSALSEAANLSGWPLNDKTSEAEIVNDIVDDILRRLRNVMCPSDNKNLVGVESTIEELIELLLSKDVCNFGNLGHSAIFTNRRSNEDIKSMASGSRVIITTRNKQVLENCKVDRIYEVKKLSHPEDLHLFSRYAFKQNLIPEDYLRLSNKGTEAVYGAVHNKVHGFQGLEFDFPELRIFVGIIIGGIFAMQFNPENLVALEMRYSNLEELWSSPVHLRKIADLSQAPNLESLILEGCTSLIEIISPSTRKLNKLVILNLRNCKSLHGLPPGIHQSNSLRFVILSGCSNLKTAPKISCNTEQLCLDGTAIKEFSSMIERPSRLVQFSLQNCSRLERLPRNFHKFKSLKHLSLSSCSNLETIPEIPRKIEELYVDGIAIEELPSSIESLSNLQTLSLRNCSRLKSLPDGICKLKSLKYLSLSGCSNIMTIPKISCKMEQLHLDETAIKELPSLIEYLSSLVTLSIKNCSSLENLPDEICNLTSLKHLYISGCSKLDRLPDDIGNLQSLEVFEANGIAATKLPSSMESLSNIRELSFERWKGQELVRSLSPMLSGLKLFKKLNLNDCNITELPNSLGDLSFLEHLYLSGNNFESIPATIINLSKLSSLDLSHCNMLQSLPNLPGDIQLLVANSCKSLQTLSDLPIPSHGYFNGNLSFINCFNLDWRTLTRILDYALSNMYEKATYTHKSPFSYMCFRGSEIPEWFNFQSTASFLELPAGSLNHNFIGFTFCTVLSFQDYKAGTLVVECELLLKCEDGLTKMGSEWDEFSEAIIKLSVTNVECVVKKCGVRLLFSQEESMNESSLCLLSDEDEDEDEPQSKRL